MTSSSAPPNRSLLQESPCAFECPICFGIPLDPILTPKCEHIFCNTCITQALQHSEHCPTCRAPFSQGQIKSLERGSMLYRMWSQIPVQCRNADRGCSWRGYVSEYQSHVQICDCQVISMNGEGTHQEDSSHLLSPESMMVAALPSPTAAQVGTIPKNVVAWTKQLGVLERQQKNLEILLEEQRKMISRLRKENEAHDPTTIPCSTRVLDCDGTVATSTISESTDHTQSSSRSSNRRDGCDAVHVQGAGIPQVNGIYKRTGSWDNVGLYTRKGLWKDNTEQTFTLYRCKTYNNSKRWCISILPTSTSTSSTSTDKDDGNHHQSCHSSSSTSLDIDFYQQEATGNRDEVPGILSSHQWVSVKKGRANDCPPIVTHLSWEIFQCIPNAS